MGSYQGAIAGASLRGREGRRGGGGTREEEKSVVFVEKGKRLFNVGQARQQKEKIPPGDSQ